MKIVNSTYRSITPLLLFIASCVGLSSVYATPILWSGNNHLYEVITSNGIAFNTARSNALALGVGWDLASITSAAEQTFITSLLPTSPSQRDHYWLGGTDTATEGDWQWLDGEVWLDGVSYENWWGGEPNGFGGEDFVAMDFRSGSWKWNDASDSSAAGLVRGYIVERVAASVPEPTTLILISLGLFGLGINRRKRLQ